MFEIIDCNNVLLDGKPQGDIVTTIANNLQGDLAGILTALKTYDDSRSAKIDEDKLAKLNAEHAAEIAALQAEVGAKDSVIADLKAQLSPAICEILSSLLLAGLEQWAESAITNADSELGVFPMVLRLKETAQKPPYIGQCQDIKNLFGTICYYSKTPPTHEQASAMQALLDAGCPSTGPVTPEYLNFHPWIKSEDA